MEVSPTDNLTHKERKVAAARMMGLTHQKAGELAYPTAKNSRLTATQALNRPRVQNAMQEAMNKAGVTLDKMALRLNEGLDAEFMGGPDLVTRHKYLDTALKNLIPKEGDKHLHVTVTEEVVASLLEE